MSTYIIIKNILEGAVKNGEIKKIELTKKGGGMFTEIHALVRNEFDCGFFDRMYPVSEMSEYLNGTRKLADRKKRKMASVMIFKNGKRMEMGFEYTLQNKKIDFTNVEVPPIGDGVCPHCDESDDVDWGEIYVDCGASNQECNCNKCGCHWHNVYKFAGVDIHS